jgi:segregation and condensation protein B
MQSEKKNQKRELKTSNERQLEKLTLIEAALYVAGRPLELKVLCSVLGTRSKKKGKKLIEILMNEYSNRNTALEILELKNERYVLQLKAQFTPYVKKLVNKPLLTSGPLKTLSYIAYRQPISQKKVIEVRGQHAYSHLRLLKEMNLILVEKKGRLLILRTSEYFADRFALSQDISVLKKELKKVFEGER